VRVLNGGWRGYDWGMRNITHRALLGLALVLWMGSVGLSQQTQPAEAASVEAAIDAKVKELEAQLEALRGERDEADAVEAEVEKVKARRVGLTRKQKRICEAEGIDPEVLVGLIGKRLYEFDEGEVDIYLRYLSVFEPELPRRVAHLARKNIGQPYEIYLLGEMPFEHYDPQPIYSLGKSDCLVYAEHTYAMALTGSWEDFIQMLQRIRYKDGRIGVATRNHYTEADWNPNNGWLVRDITAELGRGRTVKFAQKVDRAKFLLGRYKLETDIPVQEYVHEFIRYEDVDRVKGRLREGDFVNIVRGMPGKDALGKKEVAGRGGRGVRDGQAAAGSMEDIFGGSAWVGHTGLIVLGDDGEVNLIHSASPQVREESIDDYIARSIANNAERDAAGKSRLLGFKFLRLQKDPLGNLKEIDGEDAPRVVLPGGEGF
jgi:N-acetylmuramoyl-L-alanine amidase-like protein